MPAIEREKSIRELQDREAIRDCLHRYTRGIDRRDFDLLRTLFWSDAIDEHGAYNGPVSEFWAWVDQRTKHWERTMHSLSQIIIDLQGDEAAVETYFTAYHKKPNPDGTWFDEYVAGRYIDRMVKRGDDWRIQHRIVAFEWFRHMPDSADWTDSPFGAAQRGARKPDDPIYRAPKASNEMSFLGHLAHIYGVGTAMTSRGLAIDEVIDREAIRSCLHRLSRAVDRRDFELMTQCYWPDAVEEHGAFNGTVADFFVWLDERTRDWERTMFSLAQIIIDLDGDGAAVETYFTGYRKRPRPEGGWFDEFVAGRYVDKMARREGEWRIQHRVVVFEWFRRLPDSMDFAGSPFGAAQQGARKPADPLYALLSSLAD